MPATPLTVQQKLDEARAAYHALMTGVSARVVVDGGSGERVEFTSINAAKLYAYIRELEAQLPTAVPVPQAYAPAHFTF